VAGGCGEGGEGVEFAKVAVYGGSKTSTYCCILIVSCSLVAHVLRESQLNLNHIFVNGILEYMPYGNTLAIKMVR
jgi:hypothetical protein